MLLWLCCVLPLLTVCTFHPCIYLLLDQGFQSGNDQPVIDSDTCAEVTVLTTLHPSLRNCCPLCKHWNSSFCPLFLSWSWIQFPTLHVRSSFQCATPTCWQTTQMHNFWLWGTGALCCAGGLCCSHKSVVADMGIIDCLAVHSTSRFLTGETGPVHSTSICSVDSLEQACCQYTPPLSQCLCAAEAISFVANKVFPVKAAT